MRKLVSKEEREKKEKRNRFLFGFILALIMVLSTLGFALQSQLDTSSSTGTTSDTLKYNGFELVKVNGLWTVGGYAFKYSPTEVSGTIETNLNSKTSYQSLPLYIQSDDTDSEVEINLNLGQIAQRINRACLSGSNCTGDLPIKDCSDNFIIIREIDNSSNASEGISQDNNCVYIQGSKANLLKLTDQFLYRVLGIK